MNAIFIALLLVVLPSVGIAEEETGQHSIGYLLTNAVFWYMIGILFFFYGTGLGQAIRLYINFLRTGRQPIVLPGKGKDEVKRYDNPTFWELTKAIYRDEWEKCWENGLLTGITNISVLILGEIPVFLLTFTLFFPQYFSLFLIGYLGIGYIIIVFVLIMDAARCCIDKEYSKRMSNLTTRGFIVTIIFIIIYNIFL